MFIYDAIREMAFNFRLAVLHKLLTCDSKVNLLSNTTPSSLPSLLLLITVSSTTIETGSFEFTNNLHLLALDFIELSRNHLKSIFEDCFSKSNTYSIDSPHS